MAGLRVIRGPSWNQGDADGGEGHVGTVTSISASDGLVTAVWDGGQRVVVQQDSLRVLDNGTFGITHENVACSMCHELGIMGMRWKCAECDNFDLCSPCYFSDCHDRTHHFYRIETPGCTPQKVEKRSKSMKIRMMGIYPGATVMRGLNWDGKHEDGGVESEGQVTEVQASSLGSVRSAVMVQWKNGTKSKHRLGFMGMVDVRCTEEAPGGECYPQHLPVLDTKTYELQLLSASLSKDDSVVLYLSKADLQKFGQSCGGIVNCIGKVGIIQEFAATGEPIVAFDAKKFKVSHNFLKKIPQITVGDRVCVDSDEERVKVFQEGHGEYSSDMYLSLGKVGEVVKVDSEGDIVVQFTGSQKWLYNPACLSLAPDSPLDDLVSSPGVYIPAKPNETPEHELGSFAPQLFEQFLAALAMAAATQAQQDVDGRVFLEAVIANKVDAVQQMLQKDHNLVQMKVNGIGILLIAAHKGFLQITKLLVENGAEINKTDDDGHTPLLVSMKHADVAEYLINKGCDVKVGNKQKRTAAHEAAVHGQAQILHLLMNRGADLNAMDQDGDTPLHFAVIAGQASAAEVLIACPQVNLRHRNTKGFGPLHLAAYRDEALIAAMLLQKDQTLIDEQKDDGFTALHVAAFNNHTKVMKILLEQGKATVDCRQDQKQTPLHLAAEKAHMEALHVLIQHGADVNAKDNKGNRPLHTVLESQLMNETELVLLMLGILPRDRTEQQVRFACRLLQAGADPTAKNDACKTPLEVSRNETVTAAVKQFLAANPGLGRPQTQPSAATGSLGSMPDLTNRSHFNTPTPRSSAVSTSSISSLAKGPTPTSTATNLGSCPVPTSSGSTLVRGSTPTSIGSTLVRGSTPACGTTNLARGQTHVSSATSLARGPTSASRVTSLQNTSKPNLMENVSNGWTAPFSANRPVASSTTCASALASGTASSASLSTRAPFNVSTPNLTSSQNASATPKTKTGSSTPDSVNSLPGQCQVCRVQASTILMVPCGHRSACRACCIKNTFRKCPECGATVKSKFDSDGKQVKSKCTVM